MTHPSCRFAALAVLAFVLSVLAPPTISAATIRPRATLTSTAPVLAAGATQNPVRVDTVVRTVAVDSITLRRAMDSAAKRAVDSMLTQVSEDRRQWGLVVDGLLVLGGVFLVLLVWDMLSGRDVLVESHWGGFGGGVGGTRFSRTLVLTVLLLLTGGMLTVLAVARPGRVRIVESAPRSDTTAAKVDTSKAPKQGTTQRGPDQNPAASPAGRTSGG